MECIARGYLAGLGLESYRESGSISGVPLPPGLVEGSQLPEPVFTPTTKAAARRSTTSSSTFDEVARQAGAETADELRELTLAVYRRGAATAPARGVIIADTKLEFGRAPDGTLTLADEVLTPDSSRFWPADQWQPGRPAAVHRQAVRARLGDVQPDGTGARPPPEIPPDVVEATRARYVEAYELITGQSWR